MSTLKVDTLQPATGTRVSSAGHVVHSERQTTSTDVNVTSTSYTDVWTANYTPKLTTSTVMFQLSTSIRVDRNGGYDNRGNIQILHNGSSAYSINYFGEYDYGNSGSWQKVSFSETTEYSNTNGSQITWKLQVAQSSSSSATSVRFGEATSPCGSLLITEIAP